MGGSGDLRVDSCETDAVRRCRLYHQVLHPHLRRFQMYGDSTAGVPLLVPSRIPEGWIRLLEVLREVHDCILLVAEYAGKCVEGACMHLGGTYDIG